MRKFFSYIIRGISYILIFPVLPVIILGAVLCEAADRLAGIEYHPDDCDDRDEWND
jgi:hypothetical protein